MWWVFFFLFLGWVSTVNCNSGLLLLVVVVVVVDVVVAVVVIVVVVVVGDGHTMSD